MKSRIPPGHLPIVLWLIGYLASGVGCTPRVIPDVATIVVDHSKQAEPVEQTSAEEAASSTENGEQDAWKEYLERIEKLPKAPPAYDTVAEFEKQFFAATKVSWKDAVKQARKLTSDAAAIQALAKPDVAKIKEELAELEGKLGTYEKAVATKIETVSKDVQAFEKQLAAADLGVKEFASKVASICTVIDEIDKAFDKARTSVDPKADIAAIFGAAGPVQKLAGAGIDAFMSQTGATYFAAFTGLNATWSNLRNRLHEVAKLTNTPSLAAATDDAHAKMMEYNAKVAAFSMGAMQIVAMASVLGPWGTAIALCLLILAIFFGGGSGGGSGGGGPPGSGSSSKSGDGPGGSDQGTGSEEQGEEESQDETGDKNKGKGSPIATPEGATSPKFKTSNGPHQAAIHDLGDSGIQIVIAPNGTGEAAKHATFKLPANDAFSTVITALRTGECELTVLGETNVEGRFEYPQRVKVVHGDDAWLVEVPSAGADAVIPQG